MGVTTDKKNKPFNPRGNDQSPLAFNRAKLYSGKALDFDGVNDEITPSGSYFVDPQSGTWTFCAWIYAENSGVVFSRDNQWVELRLVAGKLTARVYDGAWQNLTLSNVDLLNEWNFVCWKYDVDNSTFTGYVNGVEQLTETLSPNVIANFDRIASTGGSNFFDGKIGGVKIYDVGLTAAQVADLYNNPEKVVPTGVDNTALKLWLPMQEGAGTTAINGAPDALGSEQIENGDFATDSDWTKGSGWTISGGTANCNSGSSTELYQSSAVSGKTYKITFTITSYTSGNIAARAGGVTGVVRTSTGTFTDTIVANGTQLGVFNSGGFVGSIDNVSAKEISGLGTISGATWTHGIGAPVAQTAVINWNKVNVGANAVLIPQGLTSGRDLLGNLFENVRKQGALNLDGNSWAEVHDNASLDYSSEVTLETWIYWTGEDDKGILGRWHGPSNKRSLMLYSNTATKIVGIYSSTGSATAGFLTPSQNLAAGNWYHVAFTSDGSTIKIYIDGVEGNSASYSSGFYVSDENLEIATYQNDQAKAHDGQIAQPRIYNRALTAEEVQRNYNAGKNTYTN